ncbi:MAG: hypothetical protein NTV75_03825 [Bacteroidia bacterium]|nr:hypothetical protein [Bacteroidia bacterium]
MIDSIKAVFIPIDNRILTNYQGYIRDGEMLPEVKESDLYTEKEGEYEEEKSKAERITQYIIIIPLAPLIILIFIIAEIFRSFDKVATKMTIVVDSIVGIFVNREKKRKLIKFRNELSKDVKKEDIPEFLNHCRRNFAKVILYSYHPLTPEQETQVNKLVQQDLIASCQIISCLSELSSFITTENISILNSLLVILNSEEKFEAQLLGFNIENSKSRNVELWGNGQSTSNEGTGELEWNSTEIIVKLTKNVEYYLKAKRRAFFNTELILFIEDERDPSLNTYIEKNLGQINDRLSVKGFKLLYFPSYQSGPLNIRGPILEFIRYRMPILYSLSDAELGDAVDTILRDISPAEFYKMVLEELEIPYFKRPCLLRIISSNSNLTENKFTYKPIEYRSGKDLTKFFDEYITQVAIPNPGSGIFFSLASPPDDYDADYNFNRESKELSDELKQKIDLIKAEGKYGVMIEAIMYMLGTIKEEKPDLINKIKPLLEKNKLLESEVVLSPLHIDKHYNIFLPEFGNLEVKMHALPKTVYILFLRYPVGIRFKELYQYKDELLQIYNKVTNKYEKEEIERAIDDLVDMTKPNINIQCSRIRASFRNLMDEHIARHYYIDGLNGEPKKILIPDHLIDIRY